MEGKVRDVSGPEPEWMTLPSGVQVDVNRPNFSTLKTVEDFLELKCALMEKIIDIELQIDMFKAGASEPGRKFELSWLPRATAAVKWGKLYRDECQNRMGMLSSKIADRKHEERSSKVGTRFIEAARGILPVETFVKIGTVAGMFDD